jgi:steroid delta-isomerase
VNRRNRNIVLLGAGVASAALLLSVSACRSGRKIDLVGGGRSALAKTKAPGRAAMQTPETVNASVTRFRKLFDEFRAEPVGANAASLYAQDAYFNDGFVELEGNAEIAKYLARSADATEAMHVDIEETTMTDDGVYLRWVMTYTIHYRKTTITAPGISHLRFTADGRIAYHRDYWDGTGALAELIPVTGPILRAVKSRL